MPTTSRPTDANREQRRQLTMEQTELVRSQRDAKLKEMIAIAQINVPMFARFGDELGKFLIDRGYTAPEELLFNDLKSLNLPSSEKKVIRRYQRRYLPRNLFPLSRLSTLEMEAAVCAELKKRLPDMLMQAVTEGL